MKQSGFGKGQDPMLLDEGKLHIAIMLQESGEDPQYIVPGGQLKRPVVGTIPSPYG